MEVCPENDMYTSIKMPFLSEENNTTDDLRT